MSFPRYPEYKPLASSITEEAPAHWQVMELRWIARLQSGEGITAERILPEGEYPVFGGGGLRGYTDAYTHDGEFPLIGRQGALCGNINVGRGRFWASEHSVVVSPLDGTNARWLADTLRTMNLNQYSVSAAQPGLSVDVIRRLSVPVPPHGEQHAIAAFLDRETAKIDALVAEQERLIALLKEKRQAVISHAVTKGLNPDAPMNGSGVQWLGDIPSHWRVIQSRRLFRVRSEKALPSDEQLTASQRYGIIRQADFVEREGRRVVETILGKDNLLHVEPDDFVISMRSFQGGIERSTLRGSISFHYVMLVPRSQVCPPFFAYVLKCTPYIRALQSTTDLIRDGQELRFSHFVQVPLPLLPLTEQQEIAKFLDRELRRMDSLIAHAEESLPLLHERRRALITAAVTGQIDVRGLASSEAA